MKHSSQPRCKNCGSPFTPYRSWQEYCSPPCRTQYYEHYVRHPYAKALRELDRKDSEDERKEGGKNRGEG